MQLNLPVEPNLFIVVPVSILLFVILFLSLFWLNFLLFDWLSKKIRKDEAVLKEEAYQKALDILNDSRETSLKIIQDANNKAKKILEDTDVFTGDTRSVFEREISEVHQKHTEVLDQTAQDMINVYQKVLGEEKDKSIKTLQSASDSLKEEVVSEIEDFKNVLKSETVGAQEEIESRLQKEYEVVRQELKDYKDARMKKIDESIYDILFRVSKSVLGTSITLEEQQDTVFKYLEEAKKKGVFKNE